MTLLLAFLVGKTTPLHPDEVGTIGAPILLTDPSVFLKAGESYFDPAGKRIIFQAIEHPKKGEEPDEDYGMYLGDLTFDESGTVSGLANITRVTNEDLRILAGGFTLRIHQSLCMQLQQHPSLGAMFRDTNAGLADIGGRFHQR